MSDLIDISFDVYSDTPPGKDPDAHSPTLRRYHKILWSKPLPNGTRFSLSDSCPKPFLHHNSQLGEFFLASDGIGVTLSRYAKMRSIIDQFPKDEIDYFWKHCSTIGGYILFPGIQIDRKMTLNGARGFHPRISDRFDLTLECIRRFYAAEKNPLEATLQTYSGFFNLFGSFKGYVDFFLLQDLVEEDYSSIKFFYPFESFNESPLPSDVSGYSFFKRNTTDFVSLRNRRIYEFSLSKSD